MTERLAKTAIIVLALTVGMVAVEPWLRRHVIIRRIVGVVLLTGYVLGNLYLSLLTRTPSLTARNPQIEFLWTYRKLASYRSVAMVMRSYLLEQALLNVLLYMPLGALLPFLWPSRFRTSRHARNMLAVLIVGFTCSVSVEFCQWAFNVGYPEVDDVFHNVLGALLGHVLYRSFSRLIETPSCRIHRGVRA